jgi:hypothetical protein
VDAPADSSASRTRRLARRRARRRRAAALEADEILEHGRDPRSPRAEIEVAQVDVVDLDRARLRVVQPAEQLASVVCGAFCPTMASDDPVGM